MESERSSMSVPPAVLAYLGQREVLTLATASPAGLPHAATLLYVNDGLTLYFWIRPDTVTARHVDQNPSVAFTIDEYTPDWTKTKGIQGTGECRVVLNPDEVRRVVTRFEQKFSSQAPARSTDLSFFRITPSQVHFIDNAADSGEPGDPAGRTVGLDYHRSAVFSVFSDLPDQVAETLAAKLATVHVEPGDTIVRQGAPAEKFFIIVDGEVEVVRADGGEERTVATLGAGQFFGEVAILRDTPRNATVRAVAPTTLLTMGRDVFRTLVAQSLGTTQDFDDVIRQRLAGLGLPGDAGPA